MQWRPLISRSRVGQPLQQVRSLRVTRRTRPEITGVKQDRHHEGPRPALKQPSPTSHSVQQNGGENNVTSAFEAAEQEPNEEEMEAVDEPVDPIAEPQKKAICVPNSLLEHWSESSFAPTRAQRRFANSFFTDTRTISPTADQRGSLKKFYKNTPAPLLFSAGKLYQVTVTDVPEIAIMGRSNVGKSTLMNALLGSQAARTSAKPGKTRTINAWAVGGMDRTGLKHKLTVIDMPGYGKGARQEWGNTVVKYLERRKELKRVFVLINAKHGLKNNDKEILQLLREQAIPHQAILAKVDTVLDRKKIGTKMTPSKIGRLCGQDNVASAKDELEVVRKAIEEEATKGGLPTMQDTLACSGDSQGLPGESPEPSGSLGISALRWAIISAAGLQPQQKVTDEKDLSFT